MPTHRALNLYAELEHLLPRVERLLRNDRFEPVTAADNFRIAATDFAASVIFPSFMARLAKVAPGVSLNIHPFDDTTFRQLEANAVDLALWVNSAPAEFRTQVLFHDRFMCLVRNGHPAGKKALTLDSYLSYPHALVNLAHQRQGIIDKALEDKGIKRKVQITLPYFASAAWVIEHWT